MKFKAQSLKFKINPMLVVLPLFLFLGCAAVKDAAIEGAKGIAGISTKVLEENKEGAIKRTFNCGVDVCYNDSKRLLKDRGAYIYAQDFDKKMLAVYVSETDTTPVGVFFKELDSSHTQVEVASPSTFGKEYIAEKLFRSLERLLNGEEEEVQPDAEERP